MAEGLSFARKYRSTSFDGYVGNSKAKETLRRYLKKSRPQSILITGDSGCGKTTISRLIVKEYMCEDWSEESGACGVCQTCQYFDEYIQTGVNDTLPDIYEIDSSSKSGKKDVDAMLEGIAYPPMAGDWKAYILDEAHLLSEGAMGRLLKSLEEPPEGILFILCTTDPDKLLDTIKNRCQLTLEIKRPSTAELIVHLQKICENEGKDYDIPGLRMIANRNENVVRDSMNSIETVLTTRGDATLKSVSAEFKEVSENLLFKFYESYLDKDYLSYIGMLYNVKTAYSFESFLTTLTNFTIRGIYILNSVDVDGISEEEVKSYLKLFKRFSPKDLSTVLSSLKKMNVGDIEANFMAFIYCSDSEKDDGDNVHVNLPEIPVSEEVTMRNSNIQNIESAKLDKGSSSLKSEMDSVGFSDMMGFFNLEKVQN